VRPILPAYNAELQAKLPATVWGSDCASWYLDRNGRNITLWPGFTFSYRRRTRRLDASDYIFTANRLPVAAGDEFELPATSKGV
jgi:hypothetical protein